MSILAFIFASILAVIIVPSLLIFVLCLIVGFIQSLWKYENRPHSSSKILTNKALRAKAGKIIFDRIQKNHNTTFH